MLFVNYDIHADNDEVLYSLNENDAIVAEEKYDTSRGVPKMRVRIIFFRRKSSRGIF